MSNEKRSRSQSMAGLNALTPKKKAKGHATQKNIPEYISDLVKFYSNTKQIKVLYGEIIKEEYEWLRFILMSSTANTVDIANIAVLFHKADVITFVLREGDDIRSAEWEALAKGFAEMHEMGLSTTIRFDVSRCSSDDRETMYDKALGCLSQYGEQYKCKRGRGYVLIFDAPGSSKQSNSDSVDSAATSALYERGHNMVESLSSAQSMMKIPEKPLELKEKERSVSTLWNDGKQYYFWKSHRRHPDFVEPKFKDLKDEILNSPILKGKISAKDWDNLVIKVWTSNFT